MTLRLLSSPGSTAACRFSTALGRMEMSPDSLTTMYVSGKPSGDGSRDGSGLRRRPTCRGLGVPDIAGMGAQHARTITLNLSAASKTARVTVPV